MIFITTTIESIINEENVLEAIIHLQDSKCKNDQSGLNPSLLMDYWKNNRDNIIDSIRNKNMNYFRLSNIKNYQKPERKEIYLLFL